MKAKNIAITAVGVAYAATCGMATTSSGWTLAAFTLAMVVGSVGFCIALGKIPASDFRGVSPVAVLLLGVGVGAGGLILLAYGMTMHAGIFTGFVLFGIASGGGTCVALTDAEAKQAE